MEEDDEDWFAKWFKGFLPTTAMPTVVTQHSNRMYFHDEIGSDYVLFKDWKPTDEWQTIGTCFLLFILAICYEALKYYKAYLIGYCRAENTVNSIRVSTINSSIRKSNTKCIFFGQIMSRSNIIQTIISVIQALTSYLLMLVFMSANIYLCLGIILGAGFGYFLFGFYDTISDNVIANRFHMDAPETEIL